RRVRAWGDRVARRCGAAAGPPAVLVWAAWRCPKTVAWTRSRNPSSPQRVAPGDERQWPRAPSTAPLGRPTSPAGADSSGKTSVPWISWRAMLYPWSRIHNTGERLLRQYANQDMGAHSGLDPMVDRPHQQV